MNEENELIKFEKCKVTKTGLTFNENMSYDEWVQIGRQLQLMHGSIGFWIGDWYNFGERKYGEAKAMAASLDMNYETFKQYCWVAREIEKCDRSHDLSFTSHLRIAGAPKEKQKELIKKAETEKLTSREIAILVKDTKQVRDYNNEISISAYGSEIYFNSSSAIEERWDDHILEDETKLPTITRLSRFYHKDGQEFSLREYAQVQEFPDSYKFVGTYSAIKSQIGNAVSPTMAKYVGAKLKGKTVIDLFAGCGGLSCGLEQLGKKILWANEYEKTYFQTYKVNHPNTKCVLENIKFIDADKIPDADIVVGGPPCQGFSNAGLRLKNDPRNELYKEFLRIVEAKKPGEFLLENVPQIQEIKDQIVEDFKDIGYDVKTYLVKGEEIGMKQTRHRFFFIGEKIR